MIIFVVFNLNSCLIDMIDGFMVVAVSLGSFAINNGIIIMAEVGERFVYGYWRCVKRKSCRKLNL